MEINVQSEKSIQIIDINGEVDGNTAPQVQAQIMQAAESNPRLVLDMSHVPYMSSAGLRMLLATYRNVVGHGGHVVLVGLVEEIKDTMEMTGFLDFFAHFDTLAEGVAALA